VALRPTDRTKPFRRYPNPTGRTCQWGAELGAWSSCQQTYIATDVAAWLRANGFRGTVGLEGFCRDRLGDELRSATLKFDIDFYTLAWQPSLFGELALLRTWGRLGTVGRAQAAFYPDAERARAAVVALLRRRLRHGYRVVAWR
jgi:predicted DNA-binding WGR domain protein